MLFRSVSEEELEEDLGTEDGEDDDGAAIQNAAMLQLKSDALERFAKIRVLYNKMIKALAKNGSRSRPYLKTQEEISGELMYIRFSAKQVEALCDGLRGLVEEVRSYERAIMELCVEKAAMPRAYFIKTFPGNEEDLNWVGREVGGRKAYSEVLSRFAPAILEQQQSLIDLQKRVGLPVKDRSEERRVGKECRL